MTSLSHPKTLTCERLLGSSWGLPAGAHLVIGSAQWRHYRPGNLIFQMCFEQKLGGFMGGTPLWHPLEPQKVGRWRPAGPNLNFEQFWATLGGAWGIVLGTFSILDDFPPIYSPPWAPFCSARGPLFSNQGVPDRKKQGLERG